MNGIVFLLSASTCSLLVCRNFCVLMLYAVNLLTSLTNSKRVIGGGLLFCSVFRFLGIFYVDSHVI